MRFSLNAFASERCKHAGFSLQRCRASVVIKQTNTHTQRHTENDKVHKQIFNVLGLLMLVSLSECQSVPLFIRDPVSVSGQAEKLPRMNLITD